MDKLTEVELNHDYINGEETVNKVYLKIYDAGLHYKIQKDGGTETAKSNKLIQELAELSEVFVKNLYESDLELIMDKIDEMVTPEPNKKELETFIKEGNVNLTTAIKVGDSTISQVSYKKLRVKDLIELDENNSLASNEIIKIYNRISIVFGLTMEQVKKLTYKDFVRLNNLDGVGKQICPKSQERMLKNIPLFLKALQAVA